MFDLIDVSKLEASAKRIKLRDYTSQGDTMQSTKGYEWRSILWATAAGILLLAWLAPPMRHPIRMADRIRTPGFGWSWDFNYERAMREPYLTLQDSINRVRPPRRDQFVLAPGDGASIDGLRITYRGKTTSGKLRLDVVVPALDPSYAYSYELSASEGRKGFTLFDRRFILDVMELSLIRLRPLALNSQ